MLTAIEAKKYRCLGSIRQSLGRFHVLVGQNASGKTTFFDVLLFLRDLFSQGLTAAVTKRTPDSRRLIWTDSSVTLNFQFSLAVEARAPGQILSHLSGGPFDAIRYKVCVASITDHAEIGDETVSLIHYGTNRSKAVVYINSDPNIKSPLERGVSSETSPSRNYVMRLDNDRTLLDRLPSGEFPASRWLRDFLAQGIYKIALNGEALQKPSPAAIGRDPLRTGDGAYLPWLVHELCQPGNERKMKDWIAHVRTALPDIVSVRAVERGEDGSRFIMVQYRNGSELPSWVISDGTLRLLAFTILPYIGRPGAVYLVEEPENSLHPHNIETVMQSLESVYDGQVLVSTHSPLVVGLTRPEDILVLARDERQGTTITVGSEHPGLRDWKGEVNLGTLFAGGVLG